MCKTKKEYQMKIHISDSQNVRVNVHEPKAGWLQKILSWIIRTILGIGE